MMTPREAAHGQDREYSRTAFGRCTDSIVASVLSKPRGNHHGSHSASHGITTLCRLALNRSFLFRATENQDKVQMVLGINKFVPI
jgi:hypothetical protein